MATPSRGGGGSSSLSLNDPVFVELSGSPEPLQGVVAHLGPVRFSPDADWVGVRLTGASVGKGKNDGSVRGARYFDGCGPNGGAFVRRAAVSRRTLTRLEELRLKRELSKAPGGAGVGVGGGDDASVSSAGSGHSSLTTPKARGGSGLSVPAPRSASSSATPSRKARTPALASPSSAASGGHKPKSRLDELRERRAALAATKTAISTVGSSSHAAAPSPKTPHRDEKAEAALEEQRAEIASLKGQLSELKEQLSESKEQLTSATEERASLQQALSAAEQGAHDARSEALRAREDAKEAEERAEGAEAEKERLRAERERLFTPTKAAREGEEASEAEAFAAAAAAAAAEADGLRLELSSANAAADELREELEAASRRQRETEESLLRSRSEYDSLRDALEREREARASDAESHSTELYQVRGRLTALEREVAARDESEASRAASEGAHYKERARLQAELAAARRRIEELEEEGVEKDTALEELALDKDALAEEREALEDRMEEMKIDLESGQLELEEIRAELEKERGRAEAAERAASSSGAAAAAPPPDAADSAAGAGQADADDVARALSAQNARLREALLRLREQSAQEKVELGRQLRGAERDAERGRALEKEVEDLKAAKQKLEGEVRDLKEMVDQNAAYEAMVEDLSDRVMGLEDDCAALRSTVREMEEAAEVAAEMEEVQAEENRSMMRDLEGRDAALRNLEEAIKMQRRREEEFQKTVGNYRSTVETLRQEKAALLALQEGSGDEREHVLAQSRRALARAARLAADAARARRWEADAAFARVDASARGHLSDRLESVLPLGSAAVAAEVAAVKGELMTARVAAKAAAALAGVEGVFAEAVRKGQEGIAEGAEEALTAAGEEKAAEGGPLPISDEQSQRIRTVLHQVEFAHASVDAASDAARFLSAGQWPDLLPPRASAELGAAAMRSLPPLEIALDRELRTLIEEGGLSPHRSKLAELADLVRDARASVSGAANADGDALVPDGWAPPGWEALRTVSRARFRCLGAAAALASPLCADEEGGAGAPSGALCAALSGTLGKVDLINAEAAKTCRQLAGLNVSDDKQTAEVGEAAGALDASSQSLLEAVRDLLLGGEVDPAKVADCDSKADKAMRSVARLSSCLRANKIAGEEGRSCHPLSPETQDPWREIARLVREVRVIDGDEDELNYIARANAVERQLTDAMESETKLSISNAKVVSLEKSLASRSKEIGLQNARLAELEQLLSQTMSQTAALGKSPSKKSSSAAEIETLKEENRVLNEAMETLQSQVDEYEKEIRTLKSAGKLTASAKKTPRKAQSFGAELSQSMADSAGPAISAPKALALEASLFRPALSAARSEASAWKAKAIGSAIMTLPPLSVPRPGGTALDSAEALARASAQVRMTKASFSVVDLSLSDGGGEGAIKPGSGARARPRIQLREELRRGAAAMERLEEATRRAHDALAGLSPAAGGGGAVSAAPSPRGGFGFGKGDALLGRVTIPGGDERRVVPLVVNAHELRGLHSHLLQ